MGVVSCDKKGCDSHSVNIITKQPEYYICYDCLREFESKFAGVNMTPEKWLKKFEKFMNKPKPETDYSPDAVSFADFYNAHFNDRWG